LRIKASPMDAARISNCAIIPSVKQFFGSSPK